MQPKRISLGYRPRGCRFVRIIGVKPNLADYTPDLRDLIARENRILYPTSFYAQSLSDAGKRVFPSARHYFYLGDKIRQTTLFEALGFHMPKTRVFFGRQAQNVNHYFKFPFVAKIPRGLGQGRGVYLIHGPDQWRAFLNKSRVAYVQEYLPLDRDLRVVVVAGRLLTAYWRCPPVGGFRSNIYQGGRIDVHNISEEGVDFALKVAGASGFDDVGLDVCKAKGRWMVLEANMHYGLEGLTKTKTSLPEFLDRLILEDVI